MPQIYLEHFVSAMRRIHVSPPPPPKTFRPTCVQFFKDDAALIEPCKEGWLELQVHETDLHGTPAPLPARPIPISRDASHGASHVRVHIDDSPMSSH